MAEVVQPLTYSSQLVKGGQYLVEVVQHLKYYSQLVKGGQYLVEVVQPLTYSSLHSLLKVVSIW